MTRYSIQDRYTWEAELEDGTIVTEGGDLSRAVRFSLLPQVPDLPRHDIVGVKMVNRFCRGFINAMGGTTRDYAHCIVMEHARFYVRSSDGAALITPADYELYL